MSRYRRTLAPGGTYFFTVVAYQRRKILTQPKFRSALRNAITKVKANHPFTIKAWVLLPDHLHTVWQLPEGDSNYPLRWQLIKKYTSIACKSGFHDSAQMTESKKKHRELTLWQRRYFEHLIQNDDDYRLHIDYCHFNPIKHGLVSHLSDWPYSTFHKYFKNGVYTDSWAMDERSTSKKDWLQD